MQFTFILTSHLDTLNHSTRNIRMPRGNLTHYWNEICVPLAACSKQFLSPRRNLTAGHCSVR